GPVQVAVAPQCRAHRPVHARWPLRNARRCGGALQHGSEAASQPRSSASRAARTAEARRSGQGRAGRVFENAERSEVPHRPQVLRPVSVTTGSERSNDMIRWISGVSAVAVALVVGAVALTQPPPDRPGGPGRPPPPGGLERALDDLKLTDKQKDKAHK